MLKRTMRAIHAWLRDTTTSKPGPATDIDRPAVVDSSGRPIDNDLDGPRPYETWDQFIVRVQAAEL